MSIVEEIIERTPRSELSGISNNNIDESEVYLADEEELKNRYNVDTEFLELHGILPTSPVNSKDLKDIFSKEA